MRLFTQILLFLMLLVLLSAENCGGPSESYKAELKEKQISNEYQDIENEFIKDELSVEDLNAYEIRAVQKLKDIADYINIYADSGLSLEFRSQAKQMIRKYFFETNDLQNFYKGLELLEDPEKVILYNSENDGTFKTKIDSIVISGRLQMKSVSMYSGDIQFSQKIYSINAIDTVLTKTFQVRLNMLAIKVKKNFGDKTEDVWEVYLGESRF